MVFYLYRTLRGSCNVNITILLGTILKVLMKVFAANSGGAAVSNTMLCSIAFDYLGKHRYQIHRSLNPVSTNYCFNDHGQGP